MTTSDPSEYSKVVRVHPSHDHQVPRTHGYSFVSEHYPVQYRQYCREMTLARGRVLYEVWYMYEHQSAGWIVPDEILAEAKSLNFGNAFATWLEQPSDIRHTLQQALALIIAQFPRMPSHSAKEAAEDVQQPAQNQRLTRQAVEDAVVRHAVHKYTSFDFRVGDMGQRGSEILVLIKPRLREVLTSWASQHAYSKDLVPLWERHGLMDDEQEKRAKDEWTEYSQPRLTNYGGLETIANIQLGSRMRL